MIAKNCFECFTISGCHIQLYRVKSDTSDNFSYYENYGRYLKLVVLTVECRLLFPPSLTKVLYLIMDVISD